MLAIMHTSLGDITMELYENHAPKTVANFVELAKGAREWKDPKTGAKRQDPFYDGLSFHRVIENFMIQGGCPRGDGRGGPGYTFDDEIHPELSFTKDYLLAMANAGKQGGRGTNGSQFFITVSKPTHLQGKHTIFGVVADEESKKVVDRIATTPTGPGDKPVTDVVISSITFKE